MILAAYLNNINSIPSWFKHAPDIGYTNIALVAPLFIFAIGLTYGISFRRRFERFGAWKTYNRFFTRNLALIGLGFLITFGGVQTNNPPPDAKWGLLQALGAADLVTTTILQKKAKLPLDFQFPPACFLPGTSGLFLALRGEWHGPQWPPGGVELGSNDDHCHIHGGCLPGFGKG